MPEDKQTQYLIKVIYKSGATHEFWVTEFTIDSGVYTWNPVEQSNKPIQLGAPDIAAVWQVGIRKV